MAGKKRIRKLPPSADEARDEGPRLLPLDGKAHDISPFDPVSDSYAALGDRALKLWAKSQDQDSDSDSDHSDSDKQPPKRS